MQDTFGTFAQGLGTLSTEDMKRVAQEIYAEIAFFYERNGIFEEPVVQSAVMIALSRMAQPVQVLKVG